MILLCSWISGPREQVAGRRRDEMGCIFNFATARITRLIEAGDIKAIHEDYEAVIAPPD